MSGPPGIGSNAPLSPAPPTVQQVIDYLEYQLVELISRRDQLVTALSEWTGISDDENLGRCAETVRSARAWLRTSKDRHDEYKRPYLQDGKAVDAWFANKGIPLGTQLERVQKLMDTYGAKKEAEERRKRQKEAEEAAERARKANISAAKAVQRNLLGDDVSEKLETAARAVEEADLAQQAARAPSADLTRTRGDYGAVASMRTNWTYEVTDFAAVPDEHKIINGSSISAAMKRRDATGKPTAVIPGIRWVAQRKMGVS